jgi:hypothetical protein
MTDSTIEIVEVYKNYFYAKLSRVKNGNNVYSYVGMVKVYPNSTYFRYLSSEGFYYSTNKEELIEAAKYEMERWIESDIYPRTVETFKWP